jgi:hypothetical protein
MKCERCGAESDDLHDYCAVCSKNLCDPCMEHGHCGHIPALSGMGEDCPGDEADPPRPPSPTSAHLQILPLLLEPYGRLVGGCVLRQGRRESDRVRIVRRSDREGTGMTEDDVTDVKTPLSPPEPDPSAPVVEGWDRFAFSERCDHCSEPAAWQLWGACLYACDLHVPCITTTSKI